MKLLRDLFKENKNHKFNYGCVFLSFYFPSLYKIQDVIDPNDLYEEENDDSYGLEKDPHVTLLYGFHKEINQKQIKEILYPYASQKYVVLKGVSIFKPENYDVLKFNVNADILFEMNKVLSKLPNTTEYDYSPHMTIAYLKKGRGNKYVNLLNSKKIYYKIQSSNCFYTNTFGEKFKIF